MPLTGSPPPLLPGVAKVSFSGVYGNSTWANVMHFRLTENAPFTIADVNTLTDALKTEYAAKLHHRGVVTANHFTVTRLVYRDFTDTSTFRTTRVSDYSGDEGVAGAPAQVAYLVNWQSHDGRRGGKPRNYISGVMQSAIVGDTDLDGTVAANLSTDANGFLGGVVGLGSANLEIRDMIDYSQVDAKAWRGAAAVYEISNGSCSPFIATIRRRVDRRRG